METVITRAEPAITDQQLEILQCPACRRGKLRRTPGADLECQECNARFPASGGTVCLINQRGYSDDQQKMSAWWDDLCLQWYSSYDRTLTREKLYSLFGELEDSYRAEDHLIFQMDLPSLAGKRVLDIGCGGGIHDALFKRYGAQVSAIDISGERAAVTGRKLALVNEGTGFAAQANGENLPFADDTFDVIYSNGVMHHSESTESVLAEARRVLKPGGAIVMMLYSKVSLEYLVALVWKGLLHGYLFRYGRKYWLGACTEGTAKFGTTANPFTRAFTRKGILKLMSQFSIGSLTKEGCNISAIPYFGRRLRPRLCARRKLRWFEDSMILRAGLPDYAEYLPVEKWLAKYLGWAWKIKAIKTT